MKRLRPITIIAVGPVLTALAFSCTVTIVSRDALTLGSFAISFVVGLTEGIMLFGLIAAGEASHAKSFLRRYKAGKISADAFDLE